MPPEAQTGGGAGPPRGPGASGRHAALCPQPPAGPNARPWLSQAKDSRQKPDLPRARASLDPSTTGPSKLPSLRTRSCGLPHDWVRPGPCPPRVPRDGENEAVGPLAKAGPRTGSELAQPVQAQPFQPPTRCLCMSQRHRGRGRARQPGQGLGPGGACFRRARRRCQCGGQEGTASSWPHRGAAPTGAGRGAGGAVGLVTAWSLCPEDRRPSEVAAAAGSFSGSVTRSDAKEGLSRPGAPAGPHGISIRPSERHPRRPGLSPAPELKGRGAGDGRQSCRSGGQGSGRVRPRSVHLPGGQNQFWGCP